MKIVIISDTHNHQVATPECDVLIHCGDATNGGSLKEYSQFIDWFKEAKAKHKIYVPGNHDFGAQRDYGIVSSMMESINVNFLIDKELIIDSVIFYGTPWCPQYGRWAFMPPDNVIRDYREKIPNDVNVLVSHSPPYSILDLTLSGEKAGCKYLYDKIKKLPNLKINCFGHIHEAYGQKKIDDVLFINAAISDFNKKIPNPITIVEI